MRPILLATRNRHKTVEFAQMLGADFAVSDLCDAADVPEVEEIGETFEQNAVLKAQSIARLVPGLVVADDSGLEVSSMGGAPGVRSARYAGEKASDRENVEKLMRELRATDDRRARFVCALALAKPGEIVRVFHGSVNGRIAAEPGGRGGFGYDPVFIPDGYEQTFAELGETVKNTISHRARAIASLKEYLTARGES